MPAAGVDPSREPSDPTGAEAPDSTDHRHRRRSQPDRLPAGRPDADKQQGDARPGCFPSGELPGGSACVEQRLGPESRTASQHHPTRGYQRRHTALRFQREDVIPVHAARVIAVAKTGGASRSPRSRRASCSCLATSCAISRVSVMVRPRATSPGASGLEWASVEPLDSGASLERSQNAHATWFSPPRSRPAGAAGRETRRQPPGVRCLRIAVIHR